MAKIFFDANIFIDLVEKRQKTTISDFLGHELHISPLSIHILTYMYKYGIPNKKLADSRKYFNLIPFDENVAENAMQGPTSDFEDNVQLHSAASADCDLFLTNDKKLLSLKFFGKTRIASNFVSKD